jgi:hypothetical protein
VPSTAFTTLTGTYTSYDYSSYKVYLFTGSGTITFTSS